MCQQCGNSFFIEPTELWKKICLKCWKKNKKEESDAAFNEFMHRQYPSSKASNSIISEEMLRRLIYLCHPDKHDNSDAANTATSWLLKQRNSQ